SRIKETVRAKYRPKGTPRYGPSRRDELRKLAAKASRLAARYEGESEESYRRTRRGIIQDEYEEKWKKE
ncbi:uncharacterized protein BDZ99DRAFT_98449, partial [Mytilinidion resinicola]